jgi:hypothetical protein
VLLGPDGARYVVPLLDKVRLLAPNDQGVLLTGNEIIPPRGSKGSGTFHGRRLGPVEKPVTKSTRSERATSAFLREWLVRPPPVPHQLASRALGPARAKPHRLDRRPATTGKVSARGCSRFSCHVLPWGQHGVTMRRACE